MLVFVGGNDGGGDWVLSFGGRGVGRLGNSEGSGEGLGFEFCGRWEVVLGVG